MAKPAGFDDGRHKPTTAKWESKSPGKIAGAEGIDSIVRITRA